MFWKSTQKWRKGGKVGRTYRFDALDGLSHCVKRSHSFCSNGIDIHLAFKKVVHALDLPTVNCSVERCISVGVPEVVNVHFIH
jgi:hypothetical protein